MNVQKRLGKNVSIETFQPDEEPLIINELPHLTFNMGQGDNVLNTINELQKKGVTVVNSTKAIKNCFRIDLYNNLKKRNIQIPSFYLCETIDDVEAIPEIEWTDGMWFKRGDFHAVNDNDVKYFKNHEQFIEFTNVFTEKTKISFILQKHTRGHLFKFYGVQNSFLSFRYLGKSGFDRYNLVNDNEKKLDEKLKTVIEKLVHEIAVDLHLDVFGGDFILTENNEIYLIDFNDWPSFRTCNQEAAKYISSYALKKSERYGE